MKDRPAETPGATLDPSRLPRHVAIIMDGNGRWAKRRGLPRVAGHKRGATATRNVIRACRRLNIPYLTIYAFSLENWNRPESEVSTLMNLLSRTLAKEVVKLLKYDIRLWIIGRMDRLPPSLQRDLRHAMAETAHCRGMTLVVALSYSSRDEIARAAAALARLAAAGELAPEAIDEAALAARLDTAGIPDPDLLIRTGGERRLSNYLLWQAAYAEIYVTDVMWPDFDEAQLAAALADYARRERRFGKTSEQIVDKA
jgi:undecaprenyl diphosphate synthase